VLQLRQIAQWRRLFLTIRAQGGFTAGDCHCRLLEGIQLVHRSCNYVSSFRGKLLTYALGSPRSLAVDLTTLIGGYSLETFLWAQGYRTDFDRTRSAQVAPPRPVKPTRGLKSNRDAICGRKKHIHYEPQCIDRSIVWTHVQSRDIPERNRADCPFRQRPN
jgi:hypothetical protein